MIRHAAELWLALAICFTFGCVFGSLVNRGIALTGAGVLQARIVGAIDVVIRVVEWRILPWRNRTPFELPRVVPVPPPNFSHLPDELNLLPLPAALPEPGPALDVTPVPQNDPQRETSISPAKLAEAFERADRSGVRPLPLSGPRHGVADDLAAIKGLGKRHAARLTAAGIYHFSQIAAWTPQEIAWATAFLDSGEAILAKDWVGQATRFAGADDPTEAAKPRRKPPRPRSKRGKARKEAQHTGEAEISADPVDEFGDPVE